MLAAYSRSQGVPFLFQGLCEQTVNVLQLMEEEGFEPNLVMLNLLINAFGTAGRHLEALAVFQHIKDSVCTSSRNKMKMFFFSILVSSL
jgi:pentatricopeptide repeat protein